MNPAKDSLSMPPTLSSNARGILFMLAAILLFTLMDAAVKGLVARYPVPQLVWVRFMGQLVIILILLRGRTIALLRTPYPVMHVARATTQFATGALYFASLAYIGLAEAQALADISPVLITLGAALFLGERLGPRRLLGVFAAMIGALIIIRPGLGVFSPAALLPLAAAVTYAANALLTRAVAPKETAWTAMLYASLICTALASLTLPFVWVPITPTDLPMMVAIGMLGTLAQLFIIRSFSIAEAGVVAPFTYAGILLATLWGYLFFDDLPDAWTFVGALVIVGAGLYVWHRETILAQQA
jgi:drug/metabolite transporter (DMT)-like permease